MHDEKNFDYKNTMKVWSMIEGMVDDCLRSADVNNAEYLNISHVCRPEFVPDVPLVVRLGSLNSNLKK